MERWTFTTEILDTRKSVTDMFFEYTGDSDNLRKVGRGHIPKLQMESVCEYMRKTVKYYAPMSPRSQPVRESGNRDVFQQSAAAVRAPNSPRCLQNHTLPL